jgi:hypothetical protein
VAVGDQLLGDDRPDVAGTAGDQQLHVLTPFPVFAGRVLKAVEI